MKISKIKRRNFLKGAAEASALSVLPRSLLNLYNNAASPIQKATPVFAPDIECELTASVFFSRLL